MARMLSLWVLGGLAGDLMGRRRMKMRRLWWTGGDAGGGGSASTEMNELLVPTCCLQQQNQYDTGTRERENLEKGIFRDREKSFNLISS